MSRRPSASAMGVRGAVRVAVVALAAVGCAGAPPAPQSVTPSNVQTPSPAPPSVSVPASPTPSAIPNPTAAAGGPGWIVYQSEFGLALVKPDGTGARLLFGRDGPPDASHPEWSPDGQHIVLQAGQEGDWDIWIADADGSNARVLVDCVDPCIELDAPSYSPDARYVAFSRIDEVDGQYPASVEVLEVASGEISVLAEVTPGDWATSPSWSPDGRYLAVIYEHFENAFQPNERKVFQTIGVIDTEGPKEVRLLEGLPDWSWFPDWHPERDEIIFTGGSERWLDHETEPSNLYSVRPDGTGLAQLTDFSDTDDWVAMPSWTPDGEQILVTIIAPSGRLRLGLMSADGSMLESIGSVRVPGAHAQLAGPPD